MIKIQDYMKLSLSERQAHLRLAEPCFNRGAGGGFLQKLLAHILDTTVPPGNKVYVCHACFTRVCDNPYHLYWGTPTENALDTVKCGFPTVWQRTIAKHGLEKAHKIRVRTAIEREAMRRVS